MPESCSDLGAEGHPFAVVPKEALDEALARVEELEAGLRRIADEDVPPGLGDFSEDVTEFVRALLKEGER